MDVQNGEAGGLSKIADEAVWNYTQGTELRDPTGKELGDYYARLVSWYVDGGFTDELGKRHESGHHFKIAYWEVLNEPDFEHHTTPEQYTARYDAIVSAIRKVAPGMKFVGISRCLSVRQPTHVRVLPESEESSARHPAGHDLVSLLCDADSGPGSRGPAVHLLRPGRPLPRDARYIEEIRKRFSPSTQTTVNEIGSILPGDPKGASPSPIPIGISQAPATPTSSATSRSWDRRCRRIADWSDIRPSSPASPWSTGTPARRMRGSACWNS